MAYTFQMVLLVGNMIINQWIYMIQRYHSFRQTHTTMDDFVGGLEYALFAEHDSQLFETTS